MGTPFKMKAGKEGPMKKNFGISPMKQDKMKASQTKINAKTGVTTVDENPGSKSEKKGSKLPLNPDGSRMTKEQYIKYLAKLQKNSKSTFPNPG